jgi:hypothetical protein
MRKYHAMGGVRTKCNSAKKPISPAVQGKNGLHITVRFRNVRIRKSLLYIWYEKSYCVKLIIFYLSFKVYQDRYLFHVEYEKQIKTTIGNKFVKTIYHT